MKKSDRKLVKDLDDHTDRWTILVRVFRRWNMYQRNAPKELAAICMVLIDEEVNGCNDSFKPLSLMITST